MIHGTREGRDAGCRGNASCPATPSCSETAVRAAGDWAFGKLIAAGMTGPEAAAELARREAERAPEIQRAESEYERKRREARNAKRRERDAVPRMDVVVVHGGRRGVDTKRCLTDEVCPNYGTDKPTCRQAYNAEQRRMYAERKARG